MRHAHSCLTACTPHDADTVISVPGPRPPASRNETHRVGRNSAAQRSNHAQRLRLVRGRHARSAVRRGFGPALLRFRGRPYPDDPCSLRSAVAFDGCRFAWAVQPDLAADSAAGWVCCGRVPGGAERAEVMGAVERSLSELTGGIPGPAAACCGACRDGLAGSGLRAGRGSRSRRTASPSRAKAAVQARDRAAMLAST